MSVSAMKQALEALEWNYGTDLENIENCTAWLDKLNATIPALRQAIAEAEKQEPVAFRNTETGEFCTGGFLRKDWAKWQPLYTAPVHARPVVHAVRCTYPQCQATNGCVGACSKGQAEKQESVVGTKTWFEDGKMVTQHLYASDISQERVDETAKREHEWVDLTQEEVEEIYKETQDEFQFSQLLAYKLREKNSEWNGKGWA